MIVLSMSKISVKYMFFKSYNLKSHGTEHKALVLHIAQSSE